MHANDNDIMVVFGSGNVYADLGVPDPEGMAQKARLVGRMRNIQLARGWSVIQLAEEADIGLEQMLGLLRGKFRDIPVSALESMLDRIDPRRPRAW